MSLEKKKESLQKSIDNHKARIALLESVVRVKKKDGCDFSVVGKNFKSKFENVTVKVVNDDIGLKSYDKTLEIYGYINNIFVEEQIDLSPCIDPDMGAFDKSRIIKEPIVRPYIILTVDEIEDAIDERINAHKKWLNNQQETLNTIEELHNTYIPKIQDIMREVKETCGDNTTLYFDMKDLIKEVI